MDTEQTSKTLAPLKRASVEHGKMVCSVSRAAFCSSQENTFYTLSLVDEMKNMKIISEWLQNIFKAIWPQMCIVEAHNSKGSEGYIHIIPFGIIVETEDNEESTSMIIKCDVCSPEIILVSFAKGSNHIKVRLSKHLFSNGLSLKQNKDNVVKPNVIGDILIILEAMMPRYNMSYSFETKMKMKMIVKVCGSGGTTFTQEHFVGMIAILICTLQQMSICERLANPPARISRLHHNYTLYDEYGIVNCDCKIACQICKCHFCFCGVKGMRMFGSFLNYTLTNLLRRYHSSNFFAQHAQKLIEMFPAKSQPFVISVYKSMKKATFVHPTKINCFTGQSPANPIKFLIACCTIKSTEESLKIHFIFDDDNKNFPLNLRIRHNQVLFQQDHIFKFLGILLEYFEMGKKILKSPFTYHDFLLYIGLISFLM